MRIAKYYNNNKVEIEDLPIPEISESEVLVKVRASGICGTDVMEWYRSPKGPRVLGHEMSGDIVEVGEDVGDYEIGNRVFVSHHVPCEACCYCAEDNQTACETLHQGNFDPGGFSEYVRVPEINVENGIYILPENVSYEEGTMIEPLACALRAQKLIDVREGHKVLVLGSGVSGILNVQVAKYNGAEVIATDINEYRINQAKEFGADVVMHANETLETKVDRVIVCTGAMEAAKQAFDYIDKKGTIMFFAVPQENIPLPSVDFWRNEITVTTSYGAAPKDLEESLGLIEQKAINVEDMVTHRLPLEHAQEGFRMTAEAKESLKTVLIPTW